MCDVLLEQYSLLCLKLKHREICRYYTTVKTTTSTCIMTNNILPQPSLYLLVQIFPLRKILLFHDGIYVTSISRCDIYLGMLMMHSKYVQCSARK